LPNPESLIGVNGNVAAPEARILKGLAETPSPQNVQRGEHILKGWEQVLIFTQTRALSTFPRSVERQG